MRLTIDEATYTWDAATLTLGPESDSAEADFADQLTVLLRAINSHGLAIWSQATWVVDDLSESRQLALAFASVGIYPRELAGDLEAAGDPLALDIDQDQVQIIQ